MEIEILKLIYDYTVARKKIDRDFIYKLIEIVVAYKNIQKYVRNVSFDTKDIDIKDAICAAQYSDILNKIIIMNIIFTFDFEHYANYDYLFTEFERLLFRNIFIAQLILHELEHARQKKERKLNDNSMETMLLRTDSSFKIIIGNPGNSLIKIKQYYYKNSLLNPSERLAQINSHRTILACLTEIKNNIPNLYEFQSARTVEQLLFGYSECLNANSCPTKEYLEWIKRSDVLDKIFNQDAFYAEEIGKYSLEKRLRLGLPITMDEYQHTRDWLFNTNRFS